MMFRDGHRGVFPRQKASESEIRAAKLRDKQLKQNNEAEVNHSKYRKPSKFEIGDMVYVRNFNKSKKFDPLFLEVPFTIVDMNEVGNKMLVQHIYDGATYWRHPDDLKRYYGGLRCPNQNTHEILAPSHKTPSVPLQEDIYDDTTFFDQQITDPPVQDELDIPAEQQEPQLRRSARTGTPNPRYFNDEFVVNHVGKCMVWV